jgi:hypothetical protein
MAIPSFPIATFSPGGTRFTDSAISQAGILSSIYGTNASDSVNNGLGYQIPLVIGSSNPNVIAGLITATQISGEGAAYVAELAMDERQRRGRARVIPEPDYYTLFNGVIIAARIQSIRTWLEVSGPAASQSYNGTAALNYNGAVVQVQPTAVTFPQAAVPSGAPFFSKSLGTITAANINALITEINQAGTVCTCNCNYCTCNCNYCTCNCNYACTCNCNYSDERLKANVEYL